jgi:hypothetical protein
MDLHLINSSGTEVYQDQVAAHAVALASFGPAGVSVIGDPAVPAGRYHLRQSRSPSLQSRPPSAPSLRSRPPSAPSLQSRPPSPPGVPSPAHPAAEIAAGTYHGHTKADLGAALTVAAGPATVAEPSPVPLLRLVTNGHVAQTRIPGARAGRGNAADLVLPDVPTVSRVHASFAFAGGHWRITGLGRNGVLLNGMPLAGEQVIRDADTISWGSQPDALVSRIEIGWDRALPSRPQP